MVNHLWLAAALVMTVSAASAQTMPKGPASTSQTTKAGAAGVAARMQSQGYSEIRNLRRGNLAPQCWPYYKLSDCLFKCLALITGHDTAQVLQALANYVDGPAGHHSSQAGARFPIVRHPWLLFPVWPHVNALAAALAALTLALQSRRGRPTRQPRFVVRCRPRYLSGPGSYFSTSTT